ncbi:MULTISPECIES: C1 family peptidase [unclassified Delftia]|uniref:C1 family peptidase n=1 Tax=unclassified Delftia TaxID=2613839 RepID=UPI001902BB59|nr:MULTISPECIES: C1 family peptidase [unclassified Delftia]MBK0110965.1 hypothetical protein [Delftia sp. S65]MBK0116285.1 hypothetical protein [Delftia sp. S67]MBK0129799.1 hypothetical protein [Delftia sp. S66]
MITAQIDFSARMGEARDQGQRPTCLIFAGSDLNADSKGVGHLSTEFLCHYAAKLAGNWQPGRGFQIEHVLGALRTPGQPIEIHYPYQPYGHDTPLVVPSGDFELFNSPTARQADLTSAEIVRQLSNNKPVGLVVQVCQSLLAPKDGIIEFDPLVIPDQYHALIGVGLGIDSGSGDNHVLLRNSWGPSWGHSGHAWMPTALLDIILVDGFLI